MPSKNDILTSLDIRNQSVVSSGTYERYFEKDGKIYHHILNPFTGYPYETHLQQVTIISDASVDGDALSTTCFALGLEEGSKLIKSLDEINAVGHRMVHGGERFSESVLLNKEVLEAFAACNDLAPLHNPANLKGVNAVSAILPNIPQVGVFDTAFHQTMPDYAYMYAIPYEMYEKYGVRRYGFHGTSHRYVSKRVCEFLGVNPVGQKIHHLPYW